MSASAGRDCRAVPEGWSLVKLPKVVEINPGKPQADYLSAGAPVSFVPMPSVDERVGAITHAGTRPFGQVRKGYTAFRNGDVIMAKITPCMENGKAAVATGLVNGLGFGSSEFHVFRSRGTVLSPYLYHYLRQESFRRIAANEMTGSVGQKRVPRSFLDEVELPLPPLAEQRRIVDQIEAIFAKLEPCQSRLDKLPALLQSFRQSVLASGFLGQLTEDWREAHGDSETGTTLLRRVAASRVGKGPVTRGRRRRAHEEGGEPLALDDVPDLPEFPATWGLSCVAFGAPTIQYGTSQRAEYQSQGGVPVLRMGNIQEGRLSFRDLKWIRSEHDDLSPFVLHDGDILFNRTNSPELVGKTAVYREPGPHVFASYLIRLKCDPDLIIADFVCYWINSPWGRAWARRVRTDGVSQSNINATILGRMPLPIPSLAEQREIIRRIDALLEFAVKAASNVIEATHRVESVRQAALARAFRGELVPTEAELAEAEGCEYEPAAELLKRLQNATNAAPPRGRTRRSSAAST